MSALTQLYLTRLWWIPTLSAVTLTNPRVMQIKREYQIIFAIVNPPPPPPPRQTPARFTSATWLRATVSQDGTTSGRTAVAAGFQRRSNNKPTRFKGFFVGQCQNPSSRSRAKSLVVVTAEVRGGPPGLIHHSCFCLALRITAVSVSADSAV